MRVGRKKKENEWNYNVCVCVPPSSHPPHLFHSIVPSLPDQIQKAKCSVKMQKAIIRPSEYTNATYDGWVWDLERPPVKHRLFPLRKVALSFPHLSLVSKPHRAPGWRKWKTFVIYSQCPLLFFGHLISNLFRGGVGWSAVFWEREVRCSGHIISSGFCECFNITTVKERHVLH